LIQSLIMEHCRSMYEASQSGCMNCIYYFIDNFHDIGMDWMPLHFVSNDGHCIQYLITMGADINAKTKDDMTPLYLASVNGHIECVQFLLDNNANINIQDNMGNTPLHGASYYGHKDVVQLLLDYGANQTILNDNMNLALDIANGFSKWDLYSLKEDNFKCANEIRELIENYEPLPIIKEPDDSHRRSSKHIRTTEGLALANI
jgi:ankyrin repeat protein